MKFARCFNATGSWADKCGGVIYSYPEAVEGEQMMLAMERPAKYDVESRRQKRHRMFA